MFAAEFGHVDVLGLLLQHGAHVNLADNVSPFIISLWCNYSRFPKFIMNSQYVSMFMATCLGYF